MTESPSNETAAIALESILRWTSRNGNPAERIESIRQVAATALGRPAKRRQRFNLAEMLQGLRDNDEAPGVTREPVNALNL